LGSLYSEDAHGIDRWCLIRNDERPWRVVQTGHSSFLVFTAKQANLYQECAKGPRRVTSAKGVTEVNVTSGCWAFSDEFTLQPSAETTMTEIIMQRVRWMVNAFEEGTSAAPIPLLPEKRRVDDSSALLDSAVEKIYNASAADWVQWGSIAVAAILSTMTCSCIGYLGWRFYCYRQTPAAASAPPTPGE
jgi:hypothetical protein